MNENHETHPSYAQISANRVTSSGNGQACYGSKLRHNRYINITISRSELVRSFTADRHHDKEQLITVRLTENQFAQFITSLNIGGGTPCTLDRLAGKSVEEPPYRIEMETVKSEFAATAKEIAATLTTALKSLAAMVAPGGRHSKGGLVELQKEIEKAAREIGANMPYMAECFEETMEDIVTAAKTDIEAYMSDAVARAGITGISVPVTLQIENPNTHDKPENQDELVVKRY